MAIDKPQKPSSLLPRSFGGEKNNFSDDLIASGFEPNTRETYNGDNLNYQLDATGKELDYCEKVIDYLVNMPVNNIPLVNSNNKLDYIDKNTMLSNFADKSFSNIDDTAKAYFDSQWVNISDGVVFLNRTLSTSETPVEFTLDFLPDNASYELYLSINVYPINTSSNYYGGIIISSDIITTPIALTYSGLPGAYSIGSKSDIYVKNKKLYLSGKSYYSNAKGSLAAAAYRKLGSGFE